MQVPLRTEADYDGALVNIERYSKASGADAPHSLGGWPMPERRRVKLFRDGRGQAVRIPAEFELPGDEAILHRDGDRLVVEPVRKRGLVALLKTMKPLEEDFPDIDDPVSAREDMF